MSTAWRAYLHCEPWDLLAAGIDAVLDFAVGELGVDGIRVSAVAGAACTLRVRPGLSPRTFRVEAAAHFQPEPRRYGDTRLRPPTAAWFKSRNPLAQIAEACAKRKLLLRARVVACDNATLIERYPHAACKDVFGDASPARLCPANPDVRAYLRDLVDDLSANYAVEAIDLAEADFGPPRRFHPGRVDPAPPYDARSLATCFCASCRQLAAESGIDVEALAAHVIESFDDGRAPDRDRLRAYEQFRARVVGELVIGMRNSARGELWWDAADASGTVGSADPTYVAADPVGVVDHATCAAGVAEHLFGQIVRYDRPAVVHAPIERIGLLYPVGHDRTIEDGAPAVVREISELTTRGHRVFIFDQYGTTPAPRFDWVRQAVRFARRQAESP